MKWLLLQHYSFQFTLPVHQHKGFFVVVVVVVVVNPLQPPEIVPDDCQREELCLELPLQVSSLERKKMLHYVNGNHA